MISTKLSLFLFALYSTLSVSGQERVFETADGVKFRVETVIANLEVPWSIAFDDAGNLYFTERPGRLSVLKKNSPSADLIAEIDEVRHAGEGGLMGLVLHPDFSRNGFLYVSYTFSFKRNLANRVVRFKLVGDRLSGRKEIISYLPGSTVHNGCRIKFGPDGKLYVSTGDAAEKNIAQDFNSLGGKILRVNDDGSIPTDNPYPKSLIYAYGMRNPQGFDWHPQSGMMVETEHGPSGFDGPGGGDELNLIESGKNYGWPIIHHRQTKEGLVAPLLEYTPAVAPASGAFYSGEVFPEFRNNFFFGGLRGQRIQRVIFDEQNSKKVLREESLLQAQFGRIREVVSGPDGLLYFSTSNRDGRGKPAQNDDRVLRIVPVK